MAMTIDDARKPLHAWINDLEALRGFLDAGNPDKKDFQDAWEAALEKAKAAARDYAKAVKALP